MDSERGRAPAEEGPGEELLAAIERASRHVGGAGAGAAPVSVRFDPAAAARPLARGLAIGLILLALGASAALLLPPRRQSPEAVEADLRWAVAAVVREVEAHRLRTGRLPDPAALAPLLTERVAYEPTGDAYTVTGERDGVRVRWDGSVPLEVWLEGG